MRTCLSTALLFVVGAASAAPLYPVQAGSTLQFQGTQQGEKFTGVFKAFTAKVSFDPADLAGSSFDVTIPTGSIDSRSAERDAALGTGDWFDVAHHPAATFRTVAFRNTPAGVVADADLVIKGHTKRIAFPFRFQTLPNGAQLDAKVTLDRLDFGLGAGEWADESMVGHRVDVLVHLVLGTPPATAPAKTPKPAPSTHTAHKP